MLVTIVFTLNYKAAIWKQLFHI